MKNEISTKPHLRTVLVLALGCLLACSSEEWLPGSTEPPPDQRPPAPPATVPQAGGNAAAASCPAGFTCTTVITGENVCVKDGEMVAPSCADQAACTSMLAEGTCEMNFGMTFCVQQCSP